jgi:hypothetical protein
MPMPSSPYPETVFPSLTLKLRQVGLRLQTSLGVLAWSSLLLAMLQSVCTFFATVDGLRTIIGIGALVLADGVGKLIDQFHADWLRVAMLSFAVAGSLLNLMVLWQVRRLRNNPAARWRQRPASARKRRVEWAQMGLAALTLVLVAIEEWQHLRWAGHF